MYILHFLYHSSINGHLGSFPIWATVNNAAVNMGGQLSLEILTSILLGIYLEVRLLDLMVVLFLIFLRKLCCFS